MERLRCLRERRRSARRDHGGEQALQHRQHHGSRSCLGSGRKRGAHQRALGRSRGGFTSKVHCIGDARGRPIAFHLTPGEAADCKAYDTLIDLPEQAPDALLADKAYDTDAATCTRGLRARIIRVAGCAKPTGSAGHAGATASSKLTFRLDHPIQAGQTGRTRDRTRPMLQKRQEALAMAPSTRDPTRISEPILERGVLILRHEAGYFWTVGEDGCKNVTPRAIY